MERSLVEQTIPRGHPNYVFLHKLSNGEEVRKTCKNKFVHQIFDGWDMLIQATKTIRELNRRLITKIGLDINQVASFEDLINIEKYAFKGEEFPLYNFCALLLQSVSLSDARLPAMPGQLGPIACLGNRLLMPRDEFIGCKITPDDFENFKGRFHSGVGLKGVILLATEAWKIYLAGQNEISRSLVDQCEYLMLTNPPTESNKADWSFEEPYDKQYLPLKSREDLMFIIATLGWKNVRDMQRSASYVRNDPNGRLSKQFRNKFLPIRQQHYANMQVKAKPMVPTGTVNIGTCAWDRYRIAYDNDGEIKKDEFKSLLLTYRKAIPICDAAENCLLGAVCRLGVAGCLIAAGEMDESRVPEGIPSNTFSYSEVCKLIQEAKALMEIVDIVGYKQYVIGECPVHQFITEFEKRQVIMKKDESMKEILADNGTYDETDIISGPYLNCFGFPKAGNTWNTFKNISSASLLKKSAPPVSVEKMDNDYVSESVINNNKGGGSRKKRKGKGKKKKKKGKKR